MFTVLSKMITTFLNNTLFLTPITHRYGNCDVPNSWPENQPLSYWVSKQRQQYKLYGRQGAVTCHLTEERVNELNDAGFDWRYPILLVAPKNAFVPPPPPAVTTTVAATTTAAV